jgi:hypothetical protein
MWKLKPRWNTGCPFALGLIVDGTIRTKQGRLISARDLPPSPPCFNTPPTTLTTKTTGETPDSPAKSTFTRQLLEHKLHTLKMRYKRITQRRAKLIRAIRKTHRQKGQLEDPYIAKTQPQPRGTRHTIKRQLNFFMTIPGTPDQLANAAVPWMLKPVEQHTFRPISDNIQLWTVTTTTEKQVSPNPERRLDPSQASSTEEHNQSVMRLQQLTSNNTRAMTQMNTTHRATMMISNSKHNYEIHLKWENPMQKALNAQNGSRKTSHK